MTEPRYAGVMLRAAASLVDLLIMAPVIAFLVDEPILRIATTLGSFAFLAASVVVMYFYVIYCAVRFGGTPGKLLLRMRITMLDGTRVRWPAAVMRYIVDIAFSVAGLVVGLAASAGLAGADLLVATPSAGATLGSARTLAVMQEFWIAADVVTLLVDRRTRRALHDHIAGTVVIMVSPAEQAHRAERKHVE